MTRYITKTTREKGNLIWKWKPYYRILEKIEPVSYVIKNQLDDLTSKGHAEMLHWANIADWQISKDENCRRLKDAAYVIPPAPSDSDSSSDSDWESNLPLAKFAKRYRHERETSEVEEDIPLLELRNRLRHRDRNQGQDIEMEGQDEGFDGQNDSDNAMDVNEIQSYCIRPKIMSVKTLSRNQKHLIGDTVYFSY